MLLEGSKLVEDVFFEIPEWFSIWVFSFNEFVEIGVKKLMGSLTVVFQPRLTKQEPGFFLFTEFYKISTSVCPFQNDSALFHFLGSFLQKFKLCMRIFLFLM